jgi:sensor histidine kinase YesM
MIRSSQGKLPLVNSANDELPLRGRRPWLIWVVSFSVWTFVTLAAAGSIYELDRSTGHSMTLLTVLGLESSQILTYSPLTPFVFAFAIRYPVQRGNWMRRSLLHLGGGLVFTIAHITLRGLTPYAYWDAQTHGWVSAIWDSQAHVFRIHRSAFEQLFLGNVVDDITGTYVPIVLVAHAVAHYRRSRERELRTSQLETQLAKTRLQALQSQLQPHFLFNTMHSISALMLTDVPAADKMMTRLSDLLRMNLDNETQVATLSRELEFVNGYLEIEKIRFADRLTVIRDIAPDTLDAEVPHLLLQPLVENAVRHGISRLSSGGEIRISANHDGHNLYLAVKDNGPGLGTGDYPPSRAGLGLKTTRARLETLFGNDQTFEVRAAAQGGVEAWVRIPLQLHEVSSTHEIVSDNSKKRR